MAQTSKPDLYLNQRVSFVNYSLEQGLSNKTVAPFTMDKEGFIWVGTQDGLNRFDGYKFTTYQD
jgi:ligand-binding sensor domain-containing protein